MALDVPDPFGPDRGTRSDGAAFAGRGERGRGNAMRAEGRFHYDGGGLHHEGSRDAKAWIGERKGATGSGAPSAAPPGGTGSGGERRWRDSPTGLANRATRSGVAAGVGGRSGVGGGAGRIRTAVGGFADPCLTTWLRRPAGNAKGGGTRRPFRREGPRASQSWSGKRDSNPRLRPWQGRALPTELFPRPGAVRPPSGARM
jgi:hypothetical protein